MSVVARAHRPSAAATVPSAALMRAQEWTRGVGAGKCLLLVGRKTDNGFTVTGLWVPSIRSIREAEFEIESKDVLVRHAGANGLCILGFVATRGAQPLPLPQDALELVGFADIARGREFAGSAGACACNLLIVLTPTTYRNFGLAGRDLRGSSGVTVGDLVAQSFANVADDGSTPGQFCPQQFGGAVFQSQQPDAMASRAHAMIIGKGYYQVCWDDFAPFFSVGSKWTMTALVMGCISSIFFVHGDTWMRRLALGLPGVLPELDQMRATRLWLMPLHTASHWSLLAVRRKGGDSPPEVESLLIDSLPSQEMRTIALHVLSRCAAVVPEWSIQTGDLREAVIATQTNSRVCGYRVAWHAAQVAAAPDSIPLVELEFDTPGDRELLSELGRRYEAFAFAMSPHIGSQERALLISD